MTFREAVKEAWENLTMEDLTAFAIVLVIFILLSALDAIFS